MDEELLLLIKNCLKKDRKSQQLLYKSFYGYAMSICLRYTNNRSEAVEVLNQGFLKVFTHIDRFDQNREFKSWLGRIMINASIDNYRSNLRTAYVLDIDEVDDIGHVGLCDSNLNYADLLGMVQQLTPAYQTVFNLFAIDGYSHEEIAEQLQISVGTSKSNLHKARKKLKQMITANDESTKNILYYTENNDAFTPVISIGYA
jgi:RNA polymerase sigma factor (sigma-70 family)